MHQHLFEVDQEYHHVRLDIYLTKNLDQAPSRTFIKHLIETGQVFVNEKQVKAHYKVSEGDKIFVNMTDELPFLKNILPENIPLNIFYEDKYLIIVLKPSGMLVHPVHYERTGTLVNALLYYCQEKTLSDINSSLRPGIVHRLDRETSGLLIVAKDNRTHVRVARQFEKHRVKKRYVALVKGSVAFEEGLIDVPLGRHPKYWDKKAISFSAKAKESKTVYRVLKHFGEKATFVAFFPQSGRTHQLRVHAAYLGHTILGDAKYGDESSFPRLALHAQSIGFHHPETKDFIEFSCPVPKEFLSYH